RVLTMSPDYNSVSTALPIANVPADWPAKYPPPPTYESRRLVAGPQKIDSPFWVNVEGHQYVVINLNTGVVRPLVDAPIAYSIGWPAHARSSWSVDNKAIILPSSFLPDRSDPFPCVTVASLSTKSAECAVPIPTRQTFVYAVHFEDERNDRIVVDYMLAD